MTWFALKDAKPGHLIINETKADTLKRFLLYIYTNDYDDRDVDECYFPTATVAFTAKSPEDQLECKSASLGKSLPGRHDAKLALSRDFSTLLVSYESDNESDKTLNAKCEDEESDKTGGEINGDQTDSLKMWQEASIINNLQVYSLADRYDIPDLKDLASTKFEKAVKQWDGSGLQSVIREVYESTPTGESRLRQKIAQEVALRCPTLVSHADFMDIVTAFPDLMQSVFVQREDIWRTRVRQAHSELQKATTDLVTASKDLEDTRQELEMIKTNTDSKQAKSNRVEKDLFSLFYWDECRHCDQDFSADLERNGESWLLRCKECRTRHFPRR